MDSIPHRPVARKTSFPPRGASCSTGNRFHMATGSSLNSRRHVFLSPLHQTPTEGTRTAEATCVRRAPRSTPPREELAQLTRRVGKRACGSTCRSQPQPQTRLCLKLPLARPDSASAKKTHPATAVGFLSEQQAMKML